MYTQGMYVTVFVYYMCVYSMCVSAWYMCDLFWEDYGCVCTWSMGECSYVMFVCVHVYCFGESMECVCESCVYMHL